MGNSVRKGIAVFVDQTRIKSVQNSALGAAAAGPHPQLKGGRQTVEGYLCKGSVVIFTGTTCSRYAQVSETLTLAGTSYFTVQLDQRGDKQEVQHALWQLTQQRSLPAVFVNKSYFGDAEKIFQMHRDGTLRDLLRTELGSISEGGYDYDLVVIGGGSGGLAAAKEAASFAKKVLVLDLVTPSPKGATWGLGGTCVNVGCIPKKLMHQAALLGQAIQDSRRFGWEFEQQVSHSWSCMTAAIQKRIKALNFSYRQDLRDGKVAYLNAFGELVTSHVVKATDAQGKETCHSASMFIIATGERPRYPGIPGDREFCITSDDLFSLRHCPGHTLVVGASYVGLECAGFLAGLGLQVTVMVRSVLLRGFDQKMAQKIEEYMVLHGVQFLRPFVPTKIEQIQDGRPGKLRVTAVSTNGKETYEGEFNTVLLAIGRDACTRNIGLDRIGVKYNQQTGKIPVDEDERTSVGHIYAIGDVQEGRLELTPVAIQAGRLLARRLYGGWSTKCDYANVPTTVFTPLEYGACGLSEEAATEKYGQDDVEVYHASYCPLEWALPSRDKRSCYAKVVCHTPDDERVVGIHVLGPNAGEIIQGFAVALKCGLTKGQLDATIGIHPVCAEVLTDLTVTQRAGDAAAVRGGC
ncbi:thioredoxin reductase 1, cytoplasmic-like isoform X2 [Brienomyrus brachyistius]|uniref:thioredoxin reductase 1, cytoplasmic-like isoform X2 n=1 Tax=Brienomyrus brachyistius TaxID=42636 RepID=UPI0020B387E7|nr:thioredoxin reductase 1, cytoplasmic-like isoform X2 [Brienomyrus brachyistius]